MHVETTRNASIFASQRYGPSLAQHRQREMWFVCFYGVPVSFPKSVPVARRLWRSVWCVRLMPQVLVGRIKKRDVPRCIPPEGRPQLLILDYILIVYFTSSSHRHSKTSSGFPLHANATTVHQYSGAHLWGSMARETNHGKQKKSRNPDCSISH